MAFNFEIDLKRVPEELRPDFFQDLIFKEFGKAVGSAAVLTRNAMALETPTGATGNTANSWQLVAVQVTGTKIRGGAVSSAVSAIVLEKGATGHRPRRGALANWIRRKLPRVVTPFVIRKGVPVPADLDDEADLERIEFAITGAIKRRGLPRPGGPVRIYSKAFKELEPEILKLLQQAARRVGDEYRS